MFEGDTRVENRIGWLQLMPILAEGGFEQSGRVRGSGGVNMQLEAHLNEALPTCGCTCLEKPVERYILVRCPSVASLEYPLGHAEMA